MAEQPTHERSAESSGLLAGVGAYLLWGLLPIYFKLLAPTGAWEIVGWRIVWSLVLCLGILIVFRRLGGVVATLRSPRALVASLVAGGLLAVNWTVYVLAVSWERVTEAALGYFLNPLVSVALGVVVLGERLRRGQWLAVVIGAVGAAYMSIIAGSPSWIALSLAVSFGLYGLLKKRLGMRLPPVEGLTVETAGLIPVALVILGVVASRGGLTLGANGTGHAALLVASGVVTTVPLILFAEAARRISLVTVGLLQFMTPVMQFLVGLAYGEHISTARWIGFGIVWVALAVLVFDTLVTARRHYTTRTAAAR